MSGPCLNDRNWFYVSKQYKIRAIVDCVGCGDSFTGVLIYGLNTYEEPRQALALAGAVSCLEHSVPGDFNRVDVGDAAKPIGGDVSGRVQR